MYLQRFRLDGRRAFITGGAGGIGLATAQAFAEAGAVVTISDRDAAALDAGRAALAARGVAAETVRLDVTDSAQVRAVADGLNADAEIDILFANAGIAWPDTGAETMTDDVWLRMIDIDLNGVFWCCRSFGSHMLGRGRGTIVTTGSMSGLIANRPQRQAHYNAAKAAVHHLTRSLAAEWAARGVRVNSIAPGYIDTPMSAGGLHTPELSAVWLENTPLGRSGTADEIAAVALFLASPAASLITGSVIVADAGYTIW